MKNMGIFNKIIYYTNILFAALLLFSYVLPFLPPKTFLVLSVLNLGASFLVIINLLFLLYWLLALKKQGFLSLVVLLIGYFYIGSFYQFSSGEEINKADSFKVMNYNVRLFNLYDWIPEKGIELKISELIKVENPDIISFQEYYNHKRVDLSSYKYKYEKFHRNTSKFGLALFSKFPIINSGSLDFPNTGNNAIFIDVVKANDTIRIYNIHFESLRIDPNIEKLKDEDSEQLVNHFGKTFKKQQLQSELFLKHKGQCPYKMIICGDFNNTALSYVYRKIKGDMNDTFEEAGNGFGGTYDLKFFPLRIDFIFADEQFLVNDFKVLKERYSDHFPITTTLSLE